MNSPQDRRVWVRFFRRLCPARKRVFICFAHEDRDWFQAIRSALIARIPEAAVWDETNLQAGERWEAEIHTAIQHAWVAAVLVSEHMQRALAEDTQQPKFVRAELSALRARESLGKCRILPIRVDGCELRELDLDHVQAANDRALTEVEAENRKQVIGAVCEEVGKAYRQVVRARRLTLAVAAFVGLALLLGASFLFKPQQVEPELDKWFEFTSVDDEPKATATLLAVPEPEEFQRLVAAFPSVGTKNLILIWPPKGGGSQRGGPDGLKDAHIAHLAGFVGLQFLKLNGNGRVADVRPLAACQDLRTLHLDDTGVKDIRPLVQLRELEMLSLKQTTVSDAGPLAKCAKLKFLDLAGESLGSRDEDGDGRPDDCLDLTGARTLVTLTVNDARRLRRVVLAKMPELSKISVTKSGVAEVHFGELSCLRVVAITECDVGTLRLKDLHGLDAVEIGDNKWLRGVEILDCGGFDEISVYRNGSLEDVAITNTRRAEKEKLGMLRVYENQWLRVLAIRGYHKAEDPWIRANGTSVAEGGGTKYIGAEQGWEQSPAEGRVGDGSSPEVKGPR